MNPSELIARARRSAISAQALFDAGDLHGACNRAYYAMFDAARAALQRVGEPSASQSFKSHSGLIAAFGLHLIKPGLIPGHHGKSLRQVDQIRLVADYSDEDIDLDTAAPAIQQSSQFVEAVASYLERTAR